MSDPRLEETIHVLLVEDNIADARLVHEALRDAPAGPTFVIGHVATLGAALRAIQTRPPDVVLLDLSLPDSEHGETFRRLRAAAPDLPVVALSGIDDVSRALETVRDGAQDYLVKGHSAGELIARSLRYAIERRAAQRERERRLAAEAERAAAETALQDALHAYDRETSAASITAESYGLVPLRRALPEIFGELEAEYGAILDLALEQRAFRVEHPIAQRLRHLAGRLAFLNAGPRDALDLHVTAVRHRAAGATAERVRATMDEGRLLILELMGYLVSSYRRGRAS